MPMNLSTACVLIALSQIVSLSQSAAKEEKSLHPLQLMRLYSARAHFSLDNVAILDHSRYIDMDWTDVSEWTGCAWEEPEVEPPRLVDVLLIDVDDSGDAYGKKLSQDESQSSLWAWANAVDRKQFTYAQMIKDKRRAWNPADYPMAIRQDGPIFFWVEMNAKRIADGKLIFSSEDEALDRFSFARCENVPDADGPFIKVVEGSH